MSKIDLKGFRKGMLTVVDFSHTGKIANKNANFWKAQCDCGNFRIISTGELNRKRTPTSSCGCFHKPPEDLSGKNFYNLTVLKMDFIKKSKAYFFCKCICGKIKTICGESLKRGSTRSCGCIKKHSYEKSVEKLMSKIHKTDSECWEWQGKLKPNGYGNCGTGFPNQNAHRSAYELFKGEIPEGLWVLHTCDNKKCCNPDHLYLGTVKDNVRDAIKRGQWPTGPNKKKGNPGERNCKAKLDNDKVNFIRYLCENGFKRKEMASFFYVHPSTIERIVRGVAWSI